MCEALIINNDVIKLSKMIRNVCDSGDIKHDLDISCVCNAWHTVDPYELFAMRQNNINGQPNQGVCDIRHTIHSDEPFVMIEVNTNDSA